MGLTGIPSPLLLITDRTQARKPLIQIVEAAVVGGCRWVSLREKDLESEQRLALLKELLPCIRAYGGKLLVHADVDTAAQVAPHMDGVHLPARSDVQKARMRLGEKALIGLSGHTLDDVALSTGADYVTLGPFGKTLSKPGYEPQFGPEVLEKAAAMGRPVLALGGVDETNLGALKKAGAAGFAVMGSVMRSDDPRALVKRLLDLWNEGAENK
jgi:thiamine-phosphate pyrophosphorylase